MRILRTLVGVAVDEGIQSGEAAPGPIHRRVGRSLTARLEVQPHQFDASAPYPAAPRLLLRRGQRALVAQQDQSSTRIRTEPCGGQSEHATTGSGRSYLQPCLVRVEAIPRETVSPAAVSSTRFA